MAASGVNTTRPIDSNSDVTTPAPRPSSPSLFEPPTNVALFIRTLRFLNLDQLQDWPGITTRSFRSDGRDPYSGQKQRVRLAEWVLFRLFERWDARETKAKLQPFFPALEPLQSLKLRAAILQWLTQLKADGLLGRECSLRKSMLDDCRGDKFEEMLFLFSSAVLQKVVEATGKHMPVAQQMATQTAAAHNQNFISQSLLLAHNVSLRNCVQQRHRLLSNIGEVGSIFAAKEAELEQMMSNVELQFNEYDPRLQSLGIDLKNLKRQLREESNSDPTWLSVILSGDPESGHDPFLEDSFVNIWTSTANGVLLTYDKTSKGLLADLERRNKSQQTRLDGWRDFQAELSKRNEKFIVSRSPIKSPQRSPAKLRPKTPLKSPKKPPTLKTRATDTPTSSTKLVDPASLSPLEKKSASGSQGLHNSSQKLADVTVSPERRTDARSGHSATSATKPSRRSSTTDVAPGATMTTSETPIIKKFSNATPVAAPASPESPRRNPGVRSQHQRSRSEINSGVDSVTSNAYPPSTAVSANVSAIYSSNESSSLASRTRESLFLVSSSQRSDTTAAGQRARRPGTSHAEIPDRVIRPGSQVSEAVVEPKIRQSLSERAAQTLQQNQPAQPPSKQASGGDIAFKTPPRPAHVRSRSAQTTVTRGGHRRSRSYIESRPKYPVNPFADEADAEETSIFNCSAVASSPPRPSPAPAPSEYAASTLSPIENREIMQVDPDTQTRTTTDYEESRDLRTPVERLPKYPASPITDEEVNEAALVLNQAVMPSSPPDKEAATTPSPIINKKTTQVDAGTREELAVVEQVDAGVKTPRESLFAGEVDAASIFKTRNRLRRSPPLDSSPL